ncbi:type IV secretory pathway TraG/TraD family ATPase VirD4 [Paenibacillus mucilaginosus]
MLRWPGGALEVDIKGELTRITSERRGKVYVFDPEEALHAYDPILECQTLDGAQELARALIPEPWSLKLMNMITWYS